MITLLDWRCEGAYQGRVCGRVLLAYDPAKTTLSNLKTTQQLKCQRCGYLNGIGPSVGKRVVTAR